MHVLLYTTFQIEGMDSVDVPQIIRQFTQSQYDIIIDLISHSEHNPVREVLKTDKDTLLPISSRSEEQEQELDDQQVVLHLSRHSVDDIANATTINNQMCSSYSPQTHRCSYIS